MGRQIQIYSTEKDNEKFMDFLTINYDCNFYQEYSPTIEGLLIIDSNKTYYPNGQIKIHNKAFPWTPTYKQTKTEKKLYYIDNTYLAPIIEFLKTDIEKNRHGRLYWDKFFTGIPPTYNIHEFEKFYDSIIKWVKKSAKGTTKWAGCNIYFLENAWEQKGIEN